MLTLTASYGATSIVRRRTERSGVSSNAFTSAFKELEPIPQFKATAKLGEFLEARFSQSF